MHGLKIGFYGMTHLGLISAVAAASKKFDVIAFDFNVVLISELREKKFPIQEPQLLALTTENAERLTFVSELDQLLQADLIYVAIDVPTNDNNQSDLRPIRDALEQLRSRLRPEQIVIVLSQVCPGFTRQMNFPAHQLFYQVETLIFGRAIERATLPERFIVGCAESTQLPAKYAQFLSTFGCPVLTMRYESAELAKIAINMYLVSSVMTSNMLAELASAVTADWQDIVPALRLDKRIGEHAYLSPGLGIAGGNLERDMRTIVDQAEKNNTHADLVKVWMAESRYYQQWVWRCLQEEVLAFQQQPTIAIWGLAYKANTHSIKNSPAIILLSQLQQLGINVQVHDPLVSTSVIKNIKWCASPMEALKSADALVIMTARPEYSQVSLKDFLSAMSGRVIIDPYRISKYAEFIQAGFSIFTLGVKFEIGHKEVSHA